MKTNDWRQTTERVLEDLIDESSVQEITYLLSKVAGEKAEHILLNWQDKPLYKIWDNARRRLEALSNSLSV